MNLISCVEVVAGFFNSLDIDDSSLSLIALLAGMYGGWRLTGWHDQLKARRARVRTQTGLPRKPD